MNHFSNLLRQQTVFECLSNTWKSSSVTALHNKTPKQVVFISKAPEDLLFLVKYLMKGSVSGLKLLKYSMFKMKKIFLTLCGC